MGTNGRILPPEYFPFVRQICDDNDVLLIADEVMPGWYRTGTAFAMDHWDVLPDIMTTVKGCTSACTEQVADFFEDELFCHGHACACHALALPAIPPAVAEYKNLAASGQIERVAAHLKARLFELGERHPCIGDVHGIGHFWGIELVKNRTTKKPFNVKTDKISGAPLMTGKVAGAAMAEGLYMLPWYDNLVIAPPLIITEAQVDEAMAILDKALEIADAETENSDAPVCHSSEF